jgi:hypothetical protein
MGGAWHFRYTFVTLDMNFGVFFLSREEDFTHLLLSGFWLWGHTRKTYSEETRESNLYVGNLDAYAEEKKETGCFLRPLQRR